MVLNALKYTIQTSISKKVNLSPNHQKTCRKGKAMIEYGKIMPAHEMNVFCLSQAIGGSTLPYDDMIDICIR